MREELDEALCRDFPKLYRDRHAPGRVSRMGDGFPGDGWERLIRRLSAKLEPLLPDEHNEEGEYCCAFQVKEKFGALRVYLTWSTDEMEALIRVAEAESAVTCEECGAPGILMQKNNLLMTRCLRCAV